MQSDAVVKEIRIQASPETIFEFFTDPAKMVQWKGRKATLDPRPGGDYYVEINDMAIASGKYVEIDPPNRVVFTWGWVGDEDQPVPPGSSTVEITLTPDGDATVVRLSHTDLPDDQQAGHSEGWDLYVGRLAEVSEGRDPGPDPNGQM